MDKEYKLCNVSILLIYHWERRECLVLGVFEKAKGF